MIFEIAILSMLALVSSQILTTKYRFALARILQNDKYAKESLIETLGENEYNYYMGLITLYDHYRIKFSFSDLFFRPPSKRESSAIFYMISLFIVAWWMFFKIPTLTMVIAILLFVWTQEYVSYWRDTYVRTVSNPSFLSAAKDLYDTCKPTNRLG